METVRQYNERISDATVQIGVLRRLKSNLMKQRVCAVFEEAGLRDGDTIYQGEIAFQFDLDASTADIQNDGILWVSIYGHRNQTRPKMIGWCPVHLISRYLKPEGV